VNKRTEVTVEGNDVAGDGEREQVAAPRAMKVYPASEAEARLMIDQLRDAVRMWMTTAKILFDNEKLLVARLSKYEMVNLTPISTEL